ncbi:MAG: M24 family metallopeptidase [Firmicutes bacterium]|nr:M24 family metallopeptidase [Bacillota bacterium]MBQ2454936.1 M24 family metallopeptidase [Bacillota bacterium]MBQ4181716.1 M24 family metallopeptidase [Bacillota bacterium]MBQ5437093.1 M24 family metallopeptidase [Bacillota bacterium]
MASERLTVSQKETDRRYAAVQNAMKAKGIDALVMQTHSEIFDMYMRYLTDMKAIPDPYSVMILVPAEGEMYLLMQGQSKSPDLPVPEKLKKHHVGKFGHTTTCMCFSYTDTIPAEYVTAEIKKHGYKRLGYVGGGLMSWTSRMYFEANLPEAEWVDFTGDFDRIIAVKSEEEIILLKKTVDTHCEIAKAIPDMVRPGRKLRDIKTDILVMGQGLNCELQHNIFLNAGPHSKFAVPGPIGDEDYVLQKGDGLYYLLELAAEGGMYAEVGRPILLYEPSKEEVDAYNDYCAAEAWMATQIKPGITCQDIVRINDEYMGSRGFGKVTRMAGHGQGYGLMERPAFRMEDDMVIEKNMFYCMHPGGGGVTRPHLGMCNNYIVKENGSELMTWLPMDITVLV